MGEQVLTFVVVLEPRTTARLASIPTTGWPHVCFFSGLQPLLVHPQKSLNSYYDYHVATFPLPAEAGPFLCTQGIGGHLSHFFPESYHAIDFPLRLWDTCSMYRRWSRCRRKHKPLLLWH